MKRFVLFLVKMKDVMGIGALNLDLFYEVDDLQEFGLRQGRETCLETEEFERLRDEVERKGKFIGRSAGGSAANTIYALSLLGLDVGFIGKVGEDEEGDYILKEMGRVDVSRVKREGRTGLCLVILDGRRDRALVVQPNANDTLRYEDLDLDYLRRFRLLHMSAFRGDGPFRAQLRLMEVLPPEVRVSTDPGELYARRGLPQILPMIRRSKIVFLTEAELALLTGHDDRKEGARALLREGPEFVICKRGKRGAVAFTREGEWAFSASETEVVDNTGAGDVFDAGFIFAFLQGAPLKEGIEFAHLLASKSLKGFGRETYPKGEVLRGLPFGLVLHGKG